MIETQKAADAVEARLERAGKGTWEIRPQTGEHVLSARSRELLGIEGEGAISAQRFVAAMHPGDRERWKDAFAQLLHAEGKDECQLELRAAARPERRLALSARAFFKGTRSVRLVGTLEEVTGRRAPVALGDVCREAIEEAMLSDPGRPIERGRWEEVLGDWDHGLLLELVGHLLDNARRHNASGEPVIVSILDRNDGVLVVVVDKGRSPWSIDQRLVRLLYEIVSAHGGWLEPSSYANGTTICVWLPKVVR